MIDLNNYSQVIYVDAVNGDDTIGNGSLNSCCFSIIKAVNSATLKNTLIYLKNGVCNIENGLISTVKINIELASFG